MSSVLINIGLSSLTGWGWFLLIGITFFLVCSKEGRGALRSKILNFWSKK